VARRVSRRPTRIRPQWTRKRLPDRSDPFYTHAAKRVGPAHLEMSDQTRARGCTTQGLASGGRRLPRMRWVWTDHVRSQTERTVPRELSRVGSQGLGSPLRTR